MTASKTFKFRTAAVVLGALALAGAAAGVNAQSVQSTSVRSAIEEAASVHAIATAARLCNEISESELGRAANRLDQVHASQLAAQDWETYLIVRGSVAFRNSVFASALSRVQGGCTSEVGAVWRDVDASLIFAGATSRQTLASATSANPR
jgi:predicted phage tail protein